MSRKSRSLLMFLSSSFATIIANGIGFVATPFLLLWLGPERLGAYRVSLDWLGYLALLELGTGAALAPLILQAKASGDSERELAILAAGLRRYCLVAILTFVVGIGMVAVLPFATNTPQILRAELWAGAGVYVLAASIVFPLALYRPLAEAHQRGYIVAAFVTVQSFVIAVVGVGAAYAGAGLVGQFAANASGACLVGLGMAFHFRRSVPLRRLIHTHIGVAEASQRITSMSRQTLVQILVGRICMLTDNIVISLFLGPVAVTTFSLTQRLAALATTVLQAIGVSTWAGLCELYQLGSHDLFRQRLYELTKLAATLAGAFVVPLAVLTKPFVGLWVGSDQYAGDTVAFLSVLNATLQPIYGLWAWIFNGTGRIHRLLPFMIVSAVINLSTSVAATSAFGIAGPLIGTTFMYIAYQMWKLPNLLHSEFGVSRLRILRAMITPLLLAAMFLPGAYMIRETWPNYSWVRLAVEYLAMSAFFLAAAWFIVLNRAERSQVHRLIGRLRS